MLILKKTIVPCLSGCGFFVAVGRAFGWADWPLDGQAKLLFSTSRPSVVFVSA